jgi:hypothetical protein
VVPTRRSSNRGSSCRPGSGRRYRRLSRGRRHGLARQSIAVPEWDHRPARGAARGCRPIVALPLLRSEKPLAIPRCGRHFHPAPNQGARRQTPSGRQTRSIVVTSHLPRKRWLQGALTEGGEARQLAADAQLVPLRSRCAIGALTIESSGRARWARCVHGYRRAFESLPLKQVGR